MVVVSFFCTFTAIINQSLMITFVGDFESKTDEKGRIVLPAAFKKALSGEGEVRLVVRKDLFEDCLVIFPHSEWETELKQIQEKLNPYNREHNVFLREFFKRSAEMVLDGNGRFLVPRRLMELAGIDREVVLVGVNNKIEMWDKTRYEASGIGSDDFASLAGKLLGN